MTQREKPSTRGFPNIFVLLPPKKQIQMVCQAKMSTAKMTYQIKDARNLVTIDEFFDMSLFSSLYPLVFNSMSRISHSRELRRLQKKRVGIDISTYQICIATQYNTISYKYFTALP